jgi:cytidylate kinase
LVNDDAVKDDAVKDDAVADGPARTEVPLIIALDGPAGAGKSTVAARLAAELGLEYLDTGAMYRAVTFVAMSTGVDLTDSEVVARLARDTEILVEEGKVTVDGADATDQIRSDEVTAAVSTVAANPRVREVLVQLQREWATSRGGGVLEGRDIGSVVFPDARLKLFITASPRVRAERRVAQSGGDVDEVAEAIAARDLKDSSRSTSPLHEAAGAVVIDTSDLSIDQVVAQILEMLGP